MNNISISFIIPYYKVEIQLLHRCLNSLKAFDTIGLDWEAWIIDDGTPDSPAQSIEETFADERIHYLYKAHEGLGKARNRGIEMASKEYIHFLDADDYLYSDTCTQIIEILSKEKPQLLAFNLHKEYGLDIKNRNDKRKGITWKGNGTDFMTHHNLHGSAAGFFVQKNALGTLRFSDIPYHEDEEFTPLLFLSLDNIIITDIEAYAYYQRGSSLLHEIKEEQLTNRYHSLLTIMNRLREKATTMPMAQSYALNRRVDMLGMAMIYTLITNSPGKKFLSTMLSAMRQQVFYPLPNKKHSLLYVTFRIVTYCKHIVYALNKMYRLVH